MGKELALVLVVLFTVAMFALTPARAWLPDSIEQGIDRIVGGASVNVQGPTVQYP